MCHALEALPTNLLTPGEVKNIIIYSGCSKTVTGFKDDFMDLQPLDQHLIMEGIAGQLHATHKGTVRYEVIDSRGEVAELKTSALYMPGLKCRLLSPQYYIHEKGKGHSRLSMEYEGISFSLSPNKHVFVPYNEDTKLPVMPAFANVISSAETLAMTGCLHDEANQNLSWAKKWLLKMHVCLGHIGFKHLQWIGRKGWLGGLGIKLGDNNLDAPKCAT